MRVPLASTSSGIAALAAASVLLALVPSASAAPTSGSGSSLRPDGPRCPNRAVSVHSEKSVTLNLRCHGLRKRTIRIRKRPKHGLLGAVHQKRGRVTYRPDDGYVGRDRLVAVRRKGKRKWTTVIRLEVGPPDVFDAAPDCTPVKLQLNYQSPERFQITCRGDGLEPIRVISGPFSGRLSAVTESGDSSLRTLTATYTPDELFVGQDAIVFDAVDLDGAAHGAAAITVQPWRMRAIGDSVTAGFGYFADGSLMGVSQLLDCKPPAVVSNRCSSNSPDGPGYSGPPRWTADFGLRNDVSWAAQFANDWQGGGHITAPAMFRNYAVTGAAPSDWLPGGILSQRLNAIVAEDPDLIAMTMGANPLLTDVLLTEAGEECSFEDTVAALQACLQPFFAQVDLVGNLQAFYTALLAAPHAEVVTFHYNLSIPSVNLFDVWQLEAMIDYFNAQISTAVANTKAALPPSQARRLTLIEAQRNPQAPSPSLVPRFEIGLPPAPQQTWTAGHDCGGGDFVDGPSHQSLPTQAELIVEHPLEFCSGPEWIISADTGIHPNALGYTQFATTLANVAAAENWIPPLP